MFFLLYSALGTHSGTQFVLLGGELEGGRVAVQLLETRELWRKAALGCCVDHQQNLAAVFLECLLAATAGSAGEIKCIFPKL